MFEFADRGVKVSKEEYQAAERTLRVDLLNAQFDLREAKFAVVVLLTGDDRYGIEELIDLMHDWLDVRGLDTYIFDRPTPEEQERPRFWRSWLAIPARGRMGVFGGAWAREALIDRLADHIDDEGLDLRISHIQQFERALTDDGLLLLKFWIHLPKADLKQRLEDAEKHPDKHWWVEPRDREIYRNFDTAVPIAERYLRKTDTPEAPWYIVDGADPRARNLEVMHRLLDRLSDRLRAEAEASGAAAIDRDLRPPLPPPVTDDDAGPPGGPILSALPAPSSPASETASDDREVDLHGPLDTVDLSLQLTPDAYQAAREKWMRRLHRRSRKAWARGVSSVLVLEGWDAAGKGSAIRRVTRAMDASLYQVIPISAPTDEEKARHYLWRFWRRIPRAGRMVIFDRSWYGRLLVERVEGFARPDQWRRAFAEINDFEEQLVEHGIVLLKFWLHISPEEQLRRFEERRLTPYKKYKFTAEDERNRARWNDYVVAVNEMISRTSTEQAPWHLIPAVDKPYARIAVLETVARGLKQGLKDQKSQK